MEPGMSERGDNLRRRDCLPSPNGRRWRAAPDEGIGGAVWHAGAITSGRNPLLRPSGTFSQREKVIEPRSRSLMSTIRAGAPSPLPLLGQLSTTNAAATCATIWAKTPQYRHPGVGRGLPEAIEKCAGAIRKGVSYLQLGQVPAFAGMTVWDLECERAGTDSLNDETVLRGKGCRPGRLCGEELSDR